MYPQRSVMTCGLATALEPPYFNHAPVRGATACATRSTSCPASFNPRTRVGCNLMCPAPWHRCRSVSIHAPAWGATPRPSCLSMRPRCFNPRTRVGCDVYRDAAKRGEDMFQSTHPRGVRRWLRAVWRMPSSFQSTHPRGVRLKYYGLYVLKSYVSIHAPAWGATPAGWCRPRSGGTCFNPRTRVGCDKLCFR